MRARPTILLVDDRHENLVALEGLLRGTGAAILLALSGKEALELLLQHDVALALVDVQMPEMDGFELAELMRGVARTREIPIIFVTAGLQDGARVFKGYESGAVDFLVKPLDGRILESKVGVFLDLHRQKRELAERVTQLEAALSERRRAERALRDSEARFRQLAEALPQIVYEVDPDARPLYFNERWEQYTGCDAGDLDARIELVHPDDRAQVVERWAEAVRSGSIYECEYRIRRRDGEYRWFLSRAVPVRDATGKVIRWFGTSTDVHDLELAQKTLKEADERKNAFLAVLSHELRNPLAPIKNCVHVLERAAPGSEQARRAVQVIDRQVTQLSILVNDLLDVTRITRNKVQLQRQRLELNGVVRRTVEDNRSLFDKSGVRLELETAPGPVAIDADATRVAQIVGNLLQNAAKFSTRGGRTRIRVAVEGAEAVVRVADDGIGMAKETLASLFQPFVQADSTLDRSKGGLGLGLALVKGLVEMHGGSVAARSEGLGKGAEIEVRLPVDRAGAPEVAPASEAPRSRGRRVLIIEDNIDSAESLKEALSLCDHHVDVAHDGPEGLAMAREILPEVVLCDIGLPVMDGYEVARAFRADEALRGTYLVALSGYTLPTDLQRAADAGFDRHVAKPSTLENLDAILSGLPR